jgi:arabinofuranan 3-O-arabinosyltransferase
VVGGPGLGAPVLIDGFANGWQVAPATLAAAVHDGTVQVVLNWQPQREVNLALIISALAIIACLLIVLLPKRFRRRRKRGMHAVRGSKTDPAGEGGPVLAVPFSAEAPRVSVWVALLAAVVAGALAAAIAMPLAGIAVGAATLLVLLVPRLRVILALAAIVAIVAAGIYTAVHQSQTHIPPDGNWPTNFETASRWAWAGVVFLGAEGVVDIVLRRRRAKTEDSPGPDQL